MKTLIVSFQAGLGVFFALTVIDSLISNAPIHEPLARAVFSIGCFVTAAYLDWFMKPKKGAE